VTNATRCGVDDVLARFVLLADLHGSVGKRAGDKKQGGSVHRCHGFSRRGL
jgi:hypothetical protein